MPRVVNVRDICEQHGIPYWTEGYKQCGPGWIQLDCPFCIGNVGPHLGYNEEKGYFNCWRCGGHGVVQSLSAILKITYSAAKAMASERTTSSPGVSRVRVRVRRECKWPVGTGDIKSIHRKYLIRRGFDPDKIEKTWGIRGTGPIGPYKFRVIAPIFHPDGRMISFTGRDVTGRSALRYKACSMEREAENHKDHLYGLWLVKHDWVVVVEGPADAWRLGPGAVATFGIAYRPAQMAKMRTFKRRFILFDHGDPQARKQSKKITAELSIFHGRTWTVDIQDKDPGEMKQSDANAMMLELSRTKG